MRKSILLFAALILFAMTGAAGTEALAPSENSATKGDSDMKISIKIKSKNGSHTLTATLQDNSSARAFFELLQKGEITVSMHDYGSFEKVGSLPESLPRNDTQITTSAGDIILYQGNQITIYYDTNRWSFTRLGKIDGITQAQLKEILGAGDITATFYVAI